MKIEDFEEYLDSRLDGAECSCSPKGLPHSENCKGWYPTQESYESLTMKGEAFIQRALARHREFLEQERQNEIFYNSLMKNIVSLFEEETGNKWIPNSDRVNFWLKEKFKKCDQL